jgi:hypothetical protein
MCCLLVPSELANPYFEHEKALKHLLSAMEAIVQLKPSEVKAAAAPKAKGAAANPELEAEKQVHSHLVQYTLHCMLLCAIFKPALIESVIFTPATGSAWERILHAGLLSKSPYVRKAMDSGLRALCGFPQAHAALLPKLLAMIGQLDTMAHSAICSEYFDLCAAELKRPAPAPAAPASATAADAPASPTAVAVVPVTAAAAEKKGAPLYDAVKLVENLVDKIRKQPVLVNPLTPPTISLSFQSIHLSLYSFLFLCNAIVLCCCVVACRSRRRATSITCCAACSN